MSTSIHSVNSSTRTQLPPRADASDHPAPNGSLRTAQAVLLQSLSDAVNLRPDDLTRLPPDSEGHLSASTQIVPIDSQDQSINTAIGADKLQESLRHCAPVTRLPPEILAHVFELYVSHSDKFPPGSVSAIPHGPNCFTQVCTFWRAVAESDPHLWTSIHFYFPELRTDRDKDMPWMKHLFDLHLKRAGTLPISLTFIDHRIYHPATIDLISLLVNQLRTHARRWKCISLQLSCGYFPHLYKFTPCDLSSLEHFYINGDAVVVRQSSNGPCLNLDSATNLRSFAYSASGRGREDINLHWENLSEVSFAFTPHAGNDLTIFDQSHHLAMCQNITTCSLGVKDNMRPRLIGSQTITLPCLQTLRVRRLSSEAHARSVIDHLVLPQLNTLEIDASRLIIWNQCWHDRTFSSLLARSGCNLLQLSIQDVDFPSNELTLCLALSPGLTSLRFIPCPRSQDVSGVIQALNVAPTSRGGQTRSRRRRQTIPTLPLPQLCEITLGSSVKEYLAPMLALFRSRAGAYARSAGVAPLRRAEVVFFDLWYDRGVEQVHVPGDRLEKFATFQAGLALWESENRNENGGNENMLKASVVVDSPYLPEYIDIR